MLISLVSLGGMNRSTARSTGTTFLLGSILFVSTAGAASQVFPSGRIRFQISGTGSTARQVITIKGDDGWKGCVATFQARRLIALRLIALRDLNGNPAGDLQVAAERTSTDSLCGALVSSIVPTNNSKV
jgi:hypothetical protein